jgi:PAS domain S-box-containing protein
MQLRLRGRYGLTLVALTTTISVLLGGALLIQTDALTGKMRQSSDERVRGALYSQAEKRGRAVVAHLASNLTNSLYHLDMARIASLVSAATKQDGIVFAIAVDASGKVIHDGNPAIPSYGRKQDDAATKFALGERKVGTWRGKDILIAAAPVVAGSKILGGVTMGFSLKPVQNDIVLLEESLRRIGTRHSHDMVVTAATVTGALIFLALVLSVLIARSLTHPIDQLVHLTNRIARGDYEFELPFDRGDEIGELAAALKTMAIELNETTVSKDYMEGVLSSMLDPLLVMRADGTVEMVNAVASHLLSLDMGAKTGRPFDELLRRGEDGAESFDLQEILRAGQMESVEGVTVAADGTRQPALISYTVMPSASGGSDRILFVARDISERKEMERKLRQAQKMEAVGQLTGGVSHDFNNLLAIILGNTELIKESGTGKYQREIDAVERAALRGAELTNRLLAFSRRQALHPQYTDIGDLVDELSSMLERTMGEHRDILVRNAPDTGPISVDRGQLENAILNLVLNARDAMPEGGNILIETGTVTLEDEKRLSALDLPAGPYSFVAVTDNGSGIPESILSQVFEPFFTTKEVGRGSGLGLSMVYGFAKQSDGGVEIDSQMGQGSTIRLLFPVVDQIEKIADTSEERVSPHRGQGECVLIVEDDGDVREFIRAQVQGLAYKVLVAPNGRRALDLDNGIEDADLILTDIVMPGGMNGARFAAEALKRKPGVKVVFMSGYPDSVLPADLQSLQSAELLTKPFTVQQLSAALHTALDTS